MTEAEKFLENIKRAKIDYCKKHGLPIPEFKSEADFYISDEEWREMKGEEPRSIARPNIHVELIGHPTDADWLECKRRALVTIGKQPVNPPDSEWKRKILSARHSPIRYLRYSFYIECPSWVSVHLCRHIHAHPYVKSQRNDRQHDYDRNKAPQDSPVSMIYDVNAEELMVIANKRLCQQASPETRQLVQDMCSLAEAATPELHGLLVPMCEYQGGVCHEMYPCGKSHVPQSHSEQEVSP